MRGDLLWGDISWDCDLLCSSRDLQSRLQSRQQTPAQPAVPAGGVTRDFRPQHIHCPALSLPGWDELQPMQRSQPPPGHSSLRPHTASAPHRETPNYLQALSPSSGLSGWAGQSAARPASSATPADKPSALPGLTSWQLAEALSCLSGLCCESTARCTALVLPQAPGAAALSANVAPAAPGQWEKHRAHVPSQADPLSLSKL